MHPRFLSNLPAMHLAPQDPKVWRHPMLLPTLRVETDPGNNTRFIGKTPPFLRELRI